MTTIMITSVGRRSKLVEYFRDEVMDGGKVIATDCNALAPALYFADVHHVVPKMDDEGYLDALLTICRDENVTGILSLIDPELAFLAEHRKTFEEIGVTVLAPSQEACNLAFDKYSLYEKCIENGIPHARTYLDLMSFEEAHAHGEIDFPVFIKPRTGSASLHVGRAETLEEARLLFTAHDQMIIQQFMEGQEIGVDAYVDLLTGEVTSIFAKEKLAMRAGETDKAKSIKSDELFDLIRRTIRMADLSGPLDFDLFDADGVLYLSEINPRFGGGYPHAYACGVNFPQQIVRNLSGRVNEPAIGDYAENMYMVKHDSITIIPEAALMPKKKIR